LLQPSKVSALLRAGFLKKKVLEKILGLLKKIKIENVI